MPPTRAALSRIGAVEQQLHLRRVPRSHVAREVARNDDEGERACRAAAAPRPRSWLVDGARRQEVAGRLRPPCEQPRDAAVRLWSSTAHGTLAGLFESAQPNSSSIMIGWTSTDRR